MASIIRRLPDSPSTVGYVLSCGCVLEIDKRELLVMPTKDLYETITRMAEQHDAACPRQRHVPTFMGAPIRSDPNVSDWLLNWEPGPPARMTAQEVRAREDERFFQQMRERVSSDWNYPRRSPAQVEAAMARVPVGFRPEQLAPLAGAPAAQAPKKEIAPEKKDEWKKDRFELIELD